MRGSGPTHDAVVTEFERVAPYFAARTRGRFDDLDVVQAARVAPGSLVLEVGAGTGAFLGLFAPVARLLVGIDVTVAMLREAATTYPSMELVGGEGARLPLGAGTVDVAVTAQMIHHVRQPVPVLTEMRRVTRPGGTLVVVDQCAPEQYETALVMTELERMRDPTHAMSRPPSAYRLMAQAAGWEVTSESVHEQRERFSDWMHPREFPPGRIEAVRRFLEAHAPETGMGFEPAGDDWTFVRRRVLLVGRRS